MISRLSKLNKSIIFKNTSISISTTTTRLYCNTTNNNNNEESNIKSTSLNSKERNILLRNKQKLKNDKINNNNNNNNDNKQNEYKELKSNIIKSEFEKTLDLDKVKLPRCTGCGCNLQTNSPKEPGYIPESIALKHIENNNDLKSNNGNKQKQQEIDNSGEEYFNKFYIIKKKINENKVCQRCHILKNYGKVAPVTIPIEKFKSNLNQLKDLNCVIVKLVDLMDLNGTFIQDFRDIIGNNPVILVGNKMDLLPIDIHKDRIEQWLRSESKQNGLSHISHVQLLSSISQREGMKQFIIELEKLRRGRDVFIVGCSNVGKSTFVNSLLEEYNNRFEFTTQDKFDKQSNTTLSIQEQKEIDREKQLKSLQSKITTSVLPGTTLNLLSLPLWDNSTLFDTPGIDNPNQMIKLLSIDELKQVIPSKRIKPSLAHMIEGKSLFIGGMVRIDFFGPLSTFMIYTSNQIPLHLTSTKKADQLLSRHQGRLFTPPIINQPINWIRKDNQNSIQDSLDTIQEEEGEEVQIIDNSHLSPYNLEKLEKFKLTQIKTFSIRPDTVDFKHTFIDLVISGVGWISIKCLSKKLSTIKLLVHTPENIQVSTRRPLIPMTELYSNIK